MGRFFLGLILGFLVGGTGLSALAIMNPRGDGTDVAATAPSAEPAAPEVAAPTETPETVEAAPDAGGAPDTGGFATLSLPGGGEIDQPGAPSLGSPAISDSGGAGLSASSDSGPVRTAAAPQQVTAGIDTGSAPSVNTETAGVPEIGDPTAEGGEEALEVATLEPRPLVEGTALDTHATEFTGAADRPLMSIILIDEGTNRELRTGLVSLTSPITFAVASTMLDAEDVAVEYRSNGYEVVAIMPSAGPQAITEDTTPEELTEMVGAVTDVIPVASTLMDPIEGPLPKDRQLAGAMLDAVKVTGHGLLTYKGTGLNNVPQLAEEAGVRSDVITRVIDAEQGSANIALALERAVLDASRSGSVIVVGHVRPETVTTLFSWLLGTGSKAVTIAPVSAVLRGVE